jgi:hypothetical protein
MAPPIAANASAGTSVHPATTDTTRAATPSMAQLAPTIRVAIEIGWPFES